MGVARRPRRARQASWPWPT